MTRFKLHFVNISDITVFSFETNSFIKEDVAIANWFQGCIFEDIRELINTIPYYIKDVSGFRVFNLKPYYILFSLNDNNEVIEYNTFYTKEQFLKICFSKMPDIEGVT